MEETFFGFSALGPDGLALSEACSTTNTHPSFEDGGLQRQAAAAQLGVMGVNPWRQTQLAMGGVDVGPMRRRSGSAGSRARRVYLHAGGEGARLGAGPAADAVGRGERGGTRARLQRLLLI